MFTICSLHFILIYDIIYPVNEINHFINPIGKREINKMNKFSMLEKIAKKENAD